MISCGIGFSIAGGGEEMVGAYLVVCLFFSFLYIFFYIMYYLLRYNNSHAL